MNQMHKFLREQLNFYNSEYLAKKNLGKSVFNTEKFFKLIEESESDETQLASKSMITA